MDTGSWNGRPDTGRFTDTDRQTVQGTYPENAAQIPADSPFEEPEQAPELLGARSESLYSRNEPFWDRVYELPKEGESYPRDPNYWNHPEELADDHLLIVDTGERRSVLRGMLGSGVVKKTLIIVAILVVVAGVLFGTVFRVRSITVSGTASVSDAEIIRLSGISLGMNLPLAQCLGIFFCRLSNLITINDLPKILTLEICFYAHLPIVIIIIV